MSAESGKSLGYTGECLAKIVVGSGIAHTDISGSRECRAVDHSHMRNLEKIDCKIGGIGYCSSVGGGLAEICAYFREKIECALRNIDLSRSGLRKTR